MAQIQSPETYADGQQVTAARLNNQTNGAVLLPGAVTDQTPISGGVASGDGLIVHDASASALRKATVGEVLGGGVPVVAASVTGVAGADLVIAPSAGQKADVTGPLEADSINAVGAISSGGNSTVGGNLAVTGNSTLSGNLNANGNLTNTGVANFTGTLQYKSTPILGLYQVTANLIHQTPGFVDTFNNIRIGSFADGWAVAGGDVTSASGGVHWKEAITVPAGEMWEVTWNWSAMRGTDDGFVVGVIRNVGGGAWSQIFNSVQAPTIYTNTPLCNVEILTNTTASAVTYNYAFKSACGPGSATDQAIACHGNGATRIIRRYKIAS
jgi:hypothetical protein